MIGKKEALSVIDSKRERLCQVSDEIWEHPEILYTEYESAEILCQFFTEEGFEIERNLAGIPTAFSASWGHGAPVIGLLGEFDALDGLSQKANVIKQEEETPGGKGHGCGHNLLGAGCAAAAVAIKEYLKENNTEGTVIFFGCPAEEGGSGKSFMARDGVFGGLDFALAWHPETMNMVQVGGSLANSQILYQFFGTASHAANAPEAGRSALDAVELMNTGVQYLREHVIDSARIHYAVTNSGGRLPGIVQPYAEVLYLIRAPRNEQVSEINRRVDDIAEGAALMTGTRVEKQFIKACSSIVYNSVLGEVLQENMDSIKRYGYTDEEMRFALELSKTCGGQKLDIDSYLGSYDKARRKEITALLEPFCTKPVNDFVLPLKDQEICLMASSDVGDVSWNCPCAALSAVTWPAGVKPHTWQAVASGKSSFAKKGMLYAGKVMAGAAIDLLNDPERLQEAKLEFARRVGGGYVAPIPKDVKPPVPER